MHDHQSTQAVSTLGVDCVCSNKTDEKAVRETCCAAIPTCTIIQALMCDTFHSLGTSGESGLIKYFMSYMQAMTESMSGCEFCINEG